MNSGFSDFQDLLNITTSGEDLQALQDEVKALEEEVADNKLDISSNTLAISVNSGLISTNTTNINNNGVLISNNTSNITQNSQNINSLSQNIQNNTVDISNNTTSINNNTTSINFNATTIATLNQEVLKKDGSVDLDFGYTPSNSQSVATKDYVDTHSTSSSYLRVDGSNSMLADLNLDSNDLKLNSVNSLSATGNNAELNIHSDFDLLTFGNSAMAVGQTQIHVNRLFRVSNDIECSNLTTGNINTVNFNTLVSDVGTNASDIMDLRADKVEKSGDTMTGSLNMNGHNVSNALIVQTENLQSSIDTPLKISHLKSVVGGYTVHDMINIPDETKVNILKELDMNTNNITNCGVINGYNLGTDFLKINGSNAMTNNLDMGNHYFTNLASLYTTGDITINNQSSYLRIDNMTPQLFGSNKISIYGTNGLATRFIECNTVTAGLQCRSVLDMDNNNIINTGTINGFNLSTFNSSINSNTSNIASNVTDISTNADGITILGGNVITINSRLTTNESDIASNSSDIASNSTDITNLDTNKVSKSGDTMTGTLNFNYPNIYAEFGKNATNHTNGSGIIDYNVVSTTKHELVLRGAQSTLDTNNEKHARVDGYFQVDDGLTVLDNETILNGSSGNMVGSGIRQLYLRHPLCPSNKEYGWRMGCQNTLNTSSTDCDMYFEVMRGTSSRIAAGLWDQNGSSSAINFTGQHRCMPNFEYTEDKVGLIVESTGRYMNFIKEGEECSQISCITINDSLPVVQICTEEKSKKVFGVISREEEKDRNFQQGVFVSFFDKVEQDKRLYVNGVGEGSVYVSNKNGNIENGDYICSSGINGYGMRQNEEYLANYTVAKATMDCDFNPQLEQVKIWENGAWRYTGEYKPQYECIELDSGLKVAFIGVTYHCS